MFLPELPEITDFGLRFNTKPCISVMNAMEYYFMDLCYLKYGRSNVDKVVFDMSLNGGSVYVYNHDGFNCESENDYECEKAMNQFNNLREKLYTELHSMTRNYWKENIRF